MGYTHRLYGYPVVEGALCCGSLLGRGGGGVLNQYLGIGEPLRVETLTLFRTKNS